MLAYANQMFLDILHEDGLVIAAKGLGLDEVFHNLLKVYSDPGNLVLVLGANDEEEEYFINRLKQEDVKAQPKKVTTEYSVNDRQQLYLNGGVLFITTRILVVDMLTERIPMGKNKRFTVWKSRQKQDHHFHIFPVKSTLLLNKVKIEVKLLKR